MKVPLVIGGGVGPMAGVALHARILENTRTDGTDQSHLTVLHFSCSSRIPDRTEYLLGTETKNPARGMVEVFQSAWVALKELGYASIGAVGGIPCNTFHAPEIYAVFLHELNKRGIKIRMIHMLEETVQFLQHRFSRIRRVGVLSTTGTRKTALYRTLFEGKGCSVVEVSEERQTQVQGAIYNPSWGIKAKSPVTERARTQVLEAIQSLRTQGAEAVVLGCTELPLAIPEQILFGIPMVDPMVPLALAMIREADPSSIAPR